MNTRLLLNILILTSFFRLNATFAQVVVKEKPSPPPAVVDSHSPEKEFVWIEGHWFWDKTLKQYVWIQGKWIKGKQGKAWVPGYWVSGRGGFKWIPGRWVGGKNEAHKAKN